MNTAEKLNHVAKGLFYGSLAREAVDAAKEIEKTLCSLPDDWNNAVEKALASEYDNGDFIKEKIVNVSKRAVEIRSRVNPAGLTMASSDEAIREKALAKAKEFRFAIDKALSMYQGDMDAAYVSLAALCKQYGVEPPEVKHDEVKSIYGAFERMKCPRWWRRALRRSHVRWVEAEAIRIGMVRRWKAVYVSDNTLRRRKGQRARNTMTLASLVAVCDETGERINMEEAASSSISNPSVRRVETMVRLRGMDDWSVEQGHVAQFWTITAPSRFHAATMVDGDVEDNPKYKGATPADTQEYLCNVWEKIRAKLDREGITIYGFRVAEPHHDGTPHWHLLVFGDGKDVEGAEKIAREYAMQDSKEEKGANKHRFKVEVIDREKGSAVAYVAKYIAKHLDGKGMDGSTDESGLRIQAAIERVDAWRSCWGIRQFQFFGTHAVTVWRELRRMKESPDGPLEDAWKAAQSEAYGGGESGADWKKFMVAMDRCQVKIWQEKEALSGIYGDDVDRIYGLECNGKRYKTRDKVWRFEVLPANSGPWNNVNNCTLGRRLKKRKDGMTPSG